MNIMIIKRPKGPRILFSGTQWEEFAQDLKEQRCRGWVGQFPDADSRRNIQNQLYHWADFCGERSFHEGDFLIRYLLSMGVFLLTFFILSYVIRDPLPLVDEVLLSLGSAVLFQIWWKKKRASSLGCQQKKQQLRGWVDRIPFEESPNLKALELYLQALDSMEGQDKESLYSLGNPSYIPETVLGEKEIIWAFGQLWQKRNLKKERHSLKSRETPLPEDFEDLSCLICFEKGVFNS